MKIAITGTRGIPNQYGGFEQFAQQLSTRLVMKGHEVWIYNPHYHSLKSPVYKKVNIITKKTIERYFGAAGNYLFDFECLKDAVRREVHIIIECGYASAAPWYPFLRRNGIMLITHMDGMEWQRAKWGGLIKKLFRTAEKKAVKYSDAIICDSPVIADYYSNTYFKEAEMIPYGAEIRTEWDDGVLAEAQIIPHYYFLLIARLEPENNIKMIIEGFLASNAKESLVIVGNYNRKYGRKIFKEFGNSQRLRFLGGVFDPKLVDHLRHYSIVVIHGHSVGGTNPSLLEAMAAGSLIIAHNNPYNKWVLGENARYFHTAEELTNLIQNIDELKNLGQEFISNNIKRIRTDFQWESIVNQYEHLFSRLVEK